MLDQHTTDDPVIGPFKHLDNRRLGPPLAIKAGHAYQRTVTVQHLGHLLGVEEKILATVIRDQKTIAVGMAIDASGDQAGPFRQNVRLLAVAHELRLALHCRQSAGKTVQFVVTNIEQITQPRKADRLALIRQSLQDIFARRQWHLVLGCFTIEERVIFSDLGEFFY